MSRCSVVVAGRVVVVIILARRPRRRCGAVEPDRIHVDVAQRGQGRHRGGLLGVLHDHDSIQQVELDPLNPRDAGEPSTDHFLLGGAVHARHVKAGGGHRFPTFSS
ncbi:MAG: hypothetical protein KA226_10790 [Gemmatimonadales bacterium]|nr:hypothetical protein [Gemmatimonadales bacterium]